MHDVNEAAEYLTRKSIPQQLDSAIRILFSIKPSNVRSYLAAHFSLPEPSREGLVEVCEDMTSYCGQTAVHRIIDDALGYLCKQQPDNPRKALVEYLMIETHTLRGDKVPKNMRLISKRVRYSSTDRQYVDITDCNEMPEKQPYKQIIEVIPSEVLKTVSTEVDVTQEWLQRALSNGGHQAVLKLNSISSQIAPSLSPVRHSVISVGSPYSPLPRRVSSFSPFTSPSATHSIEIRPVGNQGAQSIVLLISVQLCSSSKNKTESPPGEHTSDTTNSTTAIDTAQVKSETDEPTETPDAGSDQAMPVSKTDLEPTNETTKNAIDPLTKQSENEKTVELILKVCGEGTGWSGDIDVAIRELWFYRDVTPHLNDVVRIPQLYWGGCGQGYGNLLLENVGELVGNRPSNTDDWEIITSTLAALHSKFLTGQKLGGITWSPNYKKPSCPTTRACLDLFGPFAGADHWLGPVMDENSIKKYRQGLARLVRWGAMSPSDIQLFDGMILNVDHMISSVSNIKTILRGDCSAWNAFITPTGEAIFYDFAEWSVGNPCGDLAYAWYSARSDDKTPADVTTLLSYYENCLQQKGVNYYHGDELKKDFSIAAIVVILYHLKSRIEQWESAYWDEDPSLETLLLTTPITWSRNGTSVNHVSEQLSAAAWEFIPVIHYEKHSYVISECTPHPISIDTLFKNNRPTESPDVDVWEEPIQYYKDLLKAFTVVAEIEGQTKKELKKQ